MTNVIHQTEANQQYNSAYTVHYTDKDLNSALEMYRTIMELHPNAPEAEYSRMQIINIVNSMVPKQVLLDANMDLAHKYLDKAGSREHA